MDTMPTRYNYPTCKMSYTEKSCHIELDKNVLLLRFQFYERTTEKLF